MLRLVFALAVAPLLAACAGFSNATLVHSPSFAVNYSPQRVLMSAAGGGLPVVVLGAPPDGASPEAVVEGLRAPAFFGGDPVALSQPTVGSPRVVIAFGGVSRAGICDLGRDGGPSAGPKTQAALAWCIGEREDASVIMTSGATLGPSDAAFAPAMNQALRALLPVQNPDDSGRRPRIPSGA